jgi:hypothetical protein
MNMLSKITSAIAVCACFALITATPAAAQAPKPDLVVGGNMWTITAFDDTSPVHTQLATQRLCFEFVAVVGTHVRYRWFSLTFPDWNGMASQEGDEVFMHGDYARDVGHDGMKWSIATNKSGSGHWFEWRENGAFGRTIGFANAQLERVGTCTYTSTNPPFVPIPYNSDGTVLEDPSGRVLTKQP